MSAVEQALVALAIRWIEEEDDTTINFIANNDEANKIAKTRTGACGRQLLRTLAGDAYKGHGYL